MSIPGCVVICIAMLFASPAFCGPCSVPFAFAPVGGDGHRDSVTILGAVEIVGTAPDGTELHGLSGLAWDRDEAVLYAVSDFGYIVWLTPRFDQGRLTAIDCVARYALRDERGARLGRPLHDAEGLTLRYASNHRPQDTELVISFEQRPRVSRFSPAGTYVDAVALPRRLAARDSYVDKNRGLEAITSLPNSQYLLGPETPLRGQPGTNLQLISIDGRTWQFPPALRGSALVGLDTIDAEHVIVLERRYLAPWQPLVISLRELALDSSTPRIRELARFSSATGWPVDNFEGIARHTADHYFMVSDDNASPFQKTLLVYMVVKPLAAD
jgi:hypothetical protein